MRTQVGMFPLCSYSFLEVLYLGSPVYSLPMNKINEGPMIGKKCERGELTVSAASLDSHGDASSVRRYKLKWSHKYDFEVYSRCVILQLH